MLASFLAAHGQVLFCLAIGLLEMIVPGFGMIGILGIVIFAVGLVTSFLRYGATIGIIIIIIGAVLAAVIRMAIIDRTHCGNCRKIA